MVHNGWLFKNESSEKKNIKMKALRKIVFLIFNASKITDIDIVLKHNLSLVFFSGLFHGAVKR